ncbi:DUF6193 family natural product biosynthesis protein [Streptomyces sp. NPDC003758]|uniref:DUF6193 family natural product biosynthesis protein n=1 Tax=Streptomyces cynarae TaxID=2981134 RepID=A0ABY6EFX6_9ACTN|nr:DUF6193 family natural product biosynthesis protein [Streptomyces cynarae]UXY24818.1 DUF6193 family natural product biosynthesis protein [Streptomyces cynarae]
MRFSTTTRPRLTAVGPCLLANSDGTYAVGRSLTSDDLSRFATAHQAVAIAVRHLPAGPGPFALGELPFRIPGGVTRDNDMPGCSSAMLEESTERQGAPLSRPRGSR